MLMYQDQYSQIPARKTFFAGANTPRGFVCDYQHYFSEDTFQKVYMIKGGSGTGKSTFIRKLGEACKDQGADITYILCSSDPDSLDGAIIEKNEKSIAIIDSTAPHTCDPHYAGACGEIVDIGAFWNSEKLEGEKDKILYHTNEKALSYQRAYRYLSAAGEIRDMQRQLSLKYFDVQKCKGAVERLCRFLKGKIGQGTLNYRRTCGISMKGAVRLTSFEMAKEIVGIEDCANISPLFFESLLLVLLEKGLDVTVSVCPFGTVCELYVAEGDIAFVPFYEGRDYTKRVNLRRFVNKEELAKTKQRRIFSSKCLSAMMEGADESLRDAGKNHFALEEIYKEAMDFSKLDSLFEKISESAIKRLS